MTNRFVRMGRKSFLWRFGVLVLGVPWAFASIYMQFVSKFGVNAVFAYPHVFVTRVLISAIFGAAFGLTVASIVWKVIIDRKPAR
jgi:hypothetical protein